MGTKSDRPASKSDRISNKSSKKSKTNKCIEFAEQRPAEETLLPPEIIRDILEYLNTPQQLFVCCMINKNWSQQAARLLWRGSPQLDPRGDPWRSPPTNIIQSTLTNRSFYFYAAQIKHLHIDGDIIGKHVREFNQAARKNRYRYEKVDTFVINVETLSVGQHIFGAPPLKLLNMFVGPSLKALNLRGQQDPTSLRWAFVKQVAEQAPGLRCVYMDFAPWAGTLEKVKAEDLVDLLQNKLKSLRQVTIGLNAPPGPTVLQHLLERGNLEVLGWGSIFTPKLTEVPSGVRLESLRVLRLENARLERVTCIDTFFKRLPDALPDLLELSLEGYGPSNPAPSVLKDLARELPQLRLFKFKDDNDCGFSIGHDDIRDLLWSWKDMERLSIQTVAGARPWLKAPIIVGVRCPRLEYLQLELRCSAGCKCLHANYHFDATASDHDAARVDYLPETLRRPTEYDALEAMNENDEQVTPYVHEQWRVCDSVIMRAGEVSQEAQQNAFARLIIIELPSKGRLRSKGRSDKDPYSMTTIFNHSKVEADLREKLLAAC